MCPPGMIGVPEHNDATEVTNCFEELDKWISYIRSLDANIIYIGPLFEFINHGYDIRDYKLTNRRLGGNDSFGKFMDQCHQKGMKVIMDDVFNRTEREFSTFKDIQEKRWDSPCKDQYKGVNFDWQSPCSDFFGYEAWQGHFELSCLSPFNLDVGFYLFDVIRSQIDEFDIDGIHLDCINVLDLNLMKGMHSQTEAMKEDFWLIGEVIRGGYSRWANNEMLHSVTDYGLHKSSYSGFDDRSFLEIARNVRQLEAVRRQFYTFVDNHDEDGIATKLKLKEHLFPMHICLFTLSGILSIYHGGERGVGGKHTNASDEALRPTISMEQENEFHYELTDLIAQLGQIHSQQKPLHTSCCQELLLTDRQCVFVRRGEDSVIITVVNNSDEPAELAIPVSLQVSETVDLLEPTDRLPISDGKVHIKLEGNWGAILKLKRENRCDS